MNADFENLQIWQKAMDLAEKYLDITVEISNTKRHFRLVEQLESAAMSIPQNIAEGKGRYSKKEFIHFLYVARGSLYESLTLLIMFNRKKWIETNIFEEVKQLSYELARILNSFINGLKARS